MQLNLAGARARVLLLRHALLRAGTWVRVVMVCAGVAWIAVSFTVLRRRALRQVGPASAQAAVAAEAS